MEKPGYRAPEPRMRKAQMSPHGPRWQREEPLVQVRPDRSASPEHDDYWPAAPQEPGNAKVEKEPWHIAQGRYREAADQGRMLKRLRYPTEPTSAPPARGRFSWLFRRREPDIRPDEERYAYVPASRADVDAAFKDRDFKSRLWNTSKAAAITGLLAFPFYSLASQIRLRAVENTPFRLGSGVVESHSPYDAAYFAVSPTATPRNPKMEKMTMDSFARGSLAKGYPMQIQLPVASLHKMDWELREKLATMLAVEVGFAEPTPEVYARVLNSVKVRAREEADKENARCEESGQPPLAEAEKLPIYHRVLDSGEYQGLSEENLHYVRDVDPETSRRWDEKLMETRKFVDENWHKPIDPDKDGKFFYTSDVKTDRNGNPIYDENGRPILERSRLPSDWDAKHVSTTVWSDKSFGGKTHKAIVVARPSTPTPAGLAKPKTPTPKAVGR